MKPKFFIYLCLLFTMISCRRLEEEPTPTINIAELPPPIILPSVTPMLTETPKPTLTPRPTITPTAIPNPTSTITPRPTPSHFGAVLQAGNATWQIAGCYPAPYHINDNGEVSVSSMIWDRIVHIIPNQNLFILRFGNIYVLDISDPANPKEAYIFDSEIEIAQAVFWGNKGYFVPTLPRYNEALTEAHYPFMVDISDPTNFIVQDQFFDQIFIKTIRVNENYIYLLVYQDPGYTNLDTDLIILTNSGASELIAKHPLIYNFYSFDNLLVTKVLPDNQVAIYDISDPTNLQFVGQVQSPRSISKYFIDDHAYYHSQHELSVWDFSNLISPEKINSIPVSGYVGSPVPVKGMAIEGDYLYLTDVVLRIIDISDRENPRLIAAPELHDENPFICNPTEQVYDIAASEPYIYLVGAGYLTILERLDSGA